MDPMIQAVVNTLVSGAIALAPAAAEQAGKSAVGEVVKDAYSRFKGYIIGKYTKVTGDISQLEEDPEDTDRQNMIGKVLEKAGAEKDEQLAELAKELLKAIQANAPAVAKRINVDITQLKVGGDASFRRIEESVKGKDWEITGNLTIEDVGKQGTNRPN